MKMKSYMTYAEGEFNLVANFYHNGRPALRMVADDGEPVAVLTVNIDNDDGSPLGFDEVAIKDYAENLGAAKTLIDGGIVERVADRIIKVGFVEVPVHKLTPAGLEFVTPKNEKPSVFDGPYQFREFYIPHRMMGGLERWVKQAIPPGDFLRAVLENDLMEALGRADDENIRNLAAYGGFLFNECPVECYGSKAKMVKWVQIGGLNGLEAMAAKAKVKANEGAPQ